MDSLTVQEFLRVEFNGYGSGYGYGDGNLLKTMQPFQKTEDYIPLLF